MATLHERFLKIAGPTDVLTFELDHDVNGRCTEGEVIICVPFARRQARTAGTQLRDELLLYALHGILHLSGHDDLNAATYAKMHAEEDRILHAIGVGKIFSASSKKIPITKRSAPHAPKH